MAAFASELTATLPHASTACCTIAPPRTDPRNRLFVVVFIQCLLTPCLDQMHRAYASTASEMCTCANQGRLDQSHAASVARTLATKLRTWPRGTDPVSPGSRMC